MDIDMDTEIEESASSEVSGQDKPDIVQELRAQWVADWDNIKNWSIEELQKIVEMLQVQLIRTGCSVDELYPYVKVSKEDWLDFLANKPDAGDKDGIIARTLINSLEAIWQEGQNYLRSLAVEKARDGHPGSIQFLLSKGDKNVNIAIQNQIVVPDKVRDMLADLG